MKKIDRWEKLEEEIWRELQLVQSQYPAYAHRFYDTKSASNLLPTQPADFMLLLRRGVIFIEAKFSKVHSSLSSCFSNSVKDHQLASAELVNRAGGLYLILFYSSVTGLCQVWDGLYCRKQRNEKKRLKDSQILAVSPSIHNIISARLV